MPSEHDTIFPYPNGRSCFRSLTDRDSNGRTALHVAARYDEHECVQFLLTRGAYKESRDSDEKTPIQLALWDYYRKGYKFGCESIKILVKARANIDRLTRFEQTNVGDPKRI